MSRKIVFHHGRAVGDNLMFTCGVRDFKLLFPEIDINISTKFPAIWENNPYLTRDLEKGQDGVEFYKVGYPIINNANNASTHFTQGFLFDMIAIADANKKLPLNLYEFCAAFANGRIGDPDISLESLAKYKGFCKDFARQRPDIHMTEEEKNTNIVKDHYGYDKYWVIAPGGKRDCTTKIWDWRRFQDVIDHFDGNIKFVSIGRSDHLVEKLSGVINLVDKFNDDFRGLFPLVYNSEGVVSGVSFLMHLAAGMEPRSIKGLKNSRKPCVAIYGGREPTTFTCYTNHQVLHTNGAFACCDNGGCWQSRVVPIPKDQDKNNRMCHKTVVREGRTIQACMDTITSEDVIRAIEKYYEGNIYEPLNSKPVTKPFKIIPYPSIEVGNRFNGKEINILASLSSKGGGEQSALMIGDLLRSAGWKVNFHPWAKVHNNWKKNDLLESFWLGDKPNKKCSIKPGIPLLFYANDQIWDFVKYGESLVDSCSGLVIGINFANGSLPKCGYLAKSGKLKAVIFQNNEKKAEFERDSIGFESTELITMFGAIEIDKFLEVCTSNRKDKEPIVILKHCTPDWRKYVTAESENTGEKIHIWQKHIFKERDTKFYKRLLDDCKFPIRFEFMEAHKELVNHFKGDKRMVFHKWDSIKVTDFLARGHIYLYRTSNKWRDQYPRVVAEALAAGLPVLTEPRDGTNDRVINGDTGIHCIDYDMFLDAVKKLRRKEKYRQAMGQHAKDWARVNLDPKLWIEVLDQLFYGKEAYHERQVLQKGNQH